MGDHADGDGTADTPRQRRNDTRPAKRRRYKSEQKAHIPVGRTTDDGDGDNPVTIDCLPNEIIAHILFLGSTDLHAQGAFVAATRSVSRHWHQVALVLWPRVGEHAYGRCLQLLKDVDPSTVRECYTKWQVVAAARRLAHQRPMEAGPDLVGVELRPYDYATAMDDAFYQSAGMDASQICAERCPGCRRAPPSCTCMCSVDCRQCDGGPLTNCDARFDQWLGDHIGGPRGEPECPHLASHYVDSDEDCARRRRDASHSPCARWRGRELSHWCAAADATKAKIYVGRCAQTLVTHALADADDIRRMSCAAVIRRAHRLHSTKTRLAERPPTATCACVRRQVAIFRGQGYTCDGRCISTSAEMATTLDLDHA